MVITTKQFQLLTDIDLVWDYLVDIYDADVLNDSFIVMTF